MTAAATTSAWDIVRIYQGFLPEDMQEGLEKKIEEYAEARVGEKLKQAISIMKEFE